MNSRNTAGSGLSACRAASLGAAAALAALLAVAPALALAASASAQAAVGGGQGSVVSQGVLAGNPSLHWTLCSDGSLAVVGSGPVEGEELLDLGDQVTSLLVGREVTSIGAEAFSCFTRLERVVFEEGSMLQAIGPRAFYGCSHLGSIRIPAQVQRIESGAFSSCFELESVEFEEDSALRSVGASAFSSCGLLSSIPLPQGLEEIGAYAFNGCVSLQNLSVPAGVSHVGEGAFEDCTALEGLQLEDPGTTEVPPSALAGTPHELAAPVVTVKAKGKGALKVSWTKVKGASAYTVFFKRSGAKAYQQLKLKNRRSATLGKLARGKRYEVYVAARKGKVLVSRSESATSPKVR